MLQDDAATLDEIKRMSGERLQVLLALPCCRPCWRVTAMWVVLMALVCHSRRTAAVRSQGSHHPVRPGCDGLEPAGHYRGC